MSILSTSLRSRSRALAATSIVATLLLFACPIVALAQPTVSALSAMSGYPGATVTITGTGFSTTAANNIVYFGAAKATVTGTPTSTSLDVTVPAGANYQQVSVLNTATGLIGYSRYAFLPTYDNSAFAPGTINMNAKSDVTVGSQPYNVAAGDFDGDGKPDLVVANNGGNSVSVLRYTGSSGSIAFTAASALTTGTAPRSIAVADFDGDGKLDVVVTNFTTNNISVFRNTTTTSTITFNTKADYTTGTGPVSVAVADLDGDGKADIVTANSTGNSVSVLRNNGSGSISFATKEDFTTTTAAQSVAIGDIDNDGKPDIAVAAATATGACVFRNVSSGGITSSSFDAQVNFTVGTNPSGIAIGDLDGDGRADLAVTNADDNTVSVLHNEGISGISSGSFAAAATFTVGTTPRNVTIGDVDGDGKADLAVANNGASSMSVLRNNGSGSISFAAKTDYATTGVARGIAIADINEDGKADIVATNSAGTTVSVFRNNPIATITAPSEICISLSAQLSSNIASGTWTSSNTSVATVTSGGLVTGATAGSVVISYTLAGGSATASITVKAGPAISSVSPLVGYPASSVTITGTGFNTIAANDIVYFGATKATVTGTPTTTEVIVTVPTGSTFKPVTVLNTGCGAIAYSRYPYLAGFDNTGFAAGSVNLAAKQDWSTTGSDAREVVIGDFDGDGKADLAVVNYTGNKVSIYRNTGSSGSIVSGSFTAGTDLTTGTGPRGITVGDINNDGKLDIMVANFSVDQVSVFRNTSSGSISFAAKVDYGTASGPYSVCTGDFDGDGRTDIATANYNAGSVSILRNTTISATTITFATKVDVTAGSQSINVAAGDLDGDGKTDLAVANYNASSVSVLRNTGTGSTIAFTAGTALTTGTNPRNVAIGDLDGDGKPDITVCHASSPSVYVYLNSTSSSTITFAASSTITAGTSAYHLSMGDINGDGKTDLVVANYGASTVSVLRNTTTSSLSFASKSDFTTGTNPYNTAVGDFDGDGKSDVAVVNNGANTISVLRNTPLEGISGTTTICAGGTTQLSNPVASGTWSSATTSVATVNSTGLVSGVTGGSAIISYATSGGTVTTTVTVNSKPDVTAGNGGAACVGNTLSLTSTTTGGTGAITYAWSGPNTFSSAAEDPSITSATTAATGSYTVVVTDINSCKDTANTSATVNPKPDVTAGTGGPLCAGNPIGLTSNGSGGTGALSYSWTGPNAFNAAIQNPSITSPTTDANGTYTVIVTDVNSCKDTATVSAIVHPKPDITAASNTPVCAGNTLELGSSVTGGTGTLVYSWTGPNSFSSPVEDPSITSSTVLASGIYTVTVTDDNSCKDTATTSAVVNPKPDVTAGNGGTVCAGNTLELTGTGTGGTGSLGYSWTGPNTFSAAVQNPTITSSTTAASGSYTVIVNDVNGCKDTATTSATVNPKPDVVAGNGGAVCVNGTVSLTSNVTGGTGSIGYSWTGPNSFSEAIQNPSIASATIAASGSYTVIVTDANSCRDTASTTVTVNAKPDIAANSNTPVCAGNTLDLGSNTTGGAAPLNYVWSGPNSFSAISQNPSITSATTAASGSYTVVVTDDNGCKDTASTAVVVNPKPDVTAGNGGAVCAGNTLTLNSTGTGGTGTLDYSWTGPNSFSAAVQNTSVLTAATSATGIYTVIVTDDNNCSDTSTTSATVNPKPDVTAGNGGAVCAGGTGNLTSTATGGTGSIGYSWTGPNAFSAAIQNPSVSSATIAANGSYTVIVTDANSCRDTASTSLTVNEKPDIAANSNTPVCAGNTLDLESSTTGGATPLNYVWSGPNSFSALTQSPSITSATTSATGSYTVIVTDDNGCKDTANVSATVNPKPDVTAGNGGAACVGNTLTLSSNATGGTGSIGYSWSGPNTFSSVIQNPSVAPATLAADGVYTVIATDANGCRDTASTAATVNRKPDITAGNNGPVCAGNTLDLTSNTTGTLVSVTQSWTGPASFTDVIQNPSIVEATTAASGSYTVIAVDFNGCRDTATTAAVVNPKPSITAINNNGPICTGTTLELTSTATGGTGTLGYAWSGPGSFSANTQNTSAVSAGGVYTLIVTDINSCSDTGATTVLVSPTPPAVTAGSNGPVCVGATLDLTSATSGGVGVLSYSWRGPNSFSSATEDPSITTATTSATGTYTVIVTDENGCKDTATTSAAVTALPVISASNNGPVCVGNALSLSSNVTGGTGALSYSWSGPNSFEALTQNTSITAAAAADDGTFSVVVTDFNGCKDTATTVVIVNPLPVITADNNGPVCAGNTLSLSSNTTAGTGAFTYSWRGPNSFTSAIANPSVAATTLAATGTYTVMVSDVNGCRDTANTAAVINPKPVVTAGNSGAACAGNALDLSSSTTNGTGAIDYSWSGPNSFSSADQNPSLTPAAVAEAGTYTVIATDVNGCMDTATSSVTVHGLPVISADNNGPVCAGFTFGLSSTVTGGTASFGYAWSGPNTFTAATANSSVTAAPMAANGIYTVIVTDHNGCKDTATTEAVINPLPVITSIGTGGAVCPGFDLTLNSDANAGTPAFTYAWSGPNSYNVTGKDQTITSAQPAAHGTYTLVVTDINGCKDTATTNGVIHPVPVITFISSNAPVCEERPLSLSSTITSGTGGYTYSWSGVGGFSAATEDPLVTSSVTTAADGDYTLIVTDDNNCKDTATTSVTVYPIQPIVGDTTVGFGQTITLSDPVTGGTWSSPTPWITKVTAATGQVQGISASTSQISYTTTHGCVATYTVTVISGINACVGQTIILSDGLGSGGTWISGNNSIGIISNSGALTGIGAGNVLITHRLATGESATTTVKVNALSPTSSILPNVCQGQTMTMVNATPGGGTWYTGDASIGTISSTGVLYGVSGGNVTVYFSPVPGCVTAKTILVNAVAPITGPASVCTGQTITLANSVAGGTWSSSSVPMASVTTGGVVTGGTTTASPVIYYKWPNGCVATATVAVRPLSPITGLSSFCQNNSVQMANATSGGVWSADPALSVNGTGLVTAIGSGTANIYYNTGTGCIATKSVSITPAAAITGPTTIVCMGQNINLTNAQSGGVWSTSNGSMATVAGNGIVTGVGTGVPNISYKWPNGCSVSVPVTVKTLLPITSGSTIMCDGTTMTVANSTTGGGTWSSDAIFSVNGSGLVTALNTGTGRIYYNATNGCVTSRTVTVNQTPVIGGVPTMCMSQTTVLSGNIAGGTWVSTSASVAFVSGGTVSGVAAGVATVSYKLASGCFSTAAVTVKALTQISGGSTSICPAGTTVFANAMAGGGIWASSNTSIATVSAGTIRGAGAAPGSKTVISFTANSNGCVATRTVTLVACREGAATATENIVTAELNVQLYPNPNKGAFTLKGTTDVADGEELNAEVINLLGQVIYRGTIKVSNGAIEERIHLQQQPANGMYMLNLQSGTARKVFHFVIGE